MKGKWRQISVPVELVERAEWLLSRFPELGFQNPTEFARAAVREKLESLEDRLQRRREWRDAVEGPVPHRSASR